MGFTSRTLLSSVDRALGVRDFPFAGGSSVKSIYSPRRILSLVLAGIEGMP